jgi:alpha-mannosidase
MNNQFFKNNFKFSASSAAHYWWLEKYYPDVFLRVKEAINENKFEFVGGTWVEFDGNMPSGESMTR